MTGKNKKLAALFISGCICILAIVAVVFYFANGSPQDRDKILEGVTIGGVEVGGMTEKEAEGAVADYVAGLMGREVTIAVADAKIAATAQELGFSSDAKETVHEACQLGKSGNFFSRFQAKSEAEAGEKKFALENQVDDAALQAYIESNCAQFNVKAKNSKLKRVKGKFKATKSRNGVEVQTEETVKAIRQALLEGTGTEPLEVAASVEVTEPKYTQEQVAKCKDLLGEYSTSYSSSGPSRANNVKIAAGRINGTIIYPEKTFSVNKTIKDRTSENGYQSAPEYASGKVVSGIGGGVCQVSTTLYNAVINAELKVVERSPHSMVVAYVDVSRDAAISGNTKDLKFKNNTDVPVYIEASADGGTLSFKIYGEETRPENRKIFFESQIIETIQPGPAKITEDASLPASYRAITQSAHVGYRAKLWKVIKIEGKEKKRVQINTSVYTAQPQYITVGRQSVTPAPGISDRPRQTRRPAKTKEPEEVTQTDQPQVMEKPQPTKKLPEPKVTKKPQVTKAPLRETPKPPPEKPPEPDIVEEEE